MVDGAVVPLLEGYHAFVGESYQVVPKQAESSSGRWDHGKLWEPWWSAAVSADTKLERIK